jgi:hypothetical protein
MVVLVVVLVQTGVMSLGAGTCLESCPDDDNAGQCAPFCDCSTCGHPSFRSSVTSPVELMMIPPCVQLAGPSPAAPAVAPAVAEILHVPKLLLV